MKQSYKRMMQVGIICIILETGLLITNILLTGNFNYIVFSMLIFWTAWTAVYFHKYKKKKKLEIPLDYLVQPVIIIEDSDKIPDELGITTERMKALEDEMERIIIEKRNTTKVMVHMSKFCLHQNEFAFSMYSLSHIIQRAAMNQAFKEAFKDNL